MSNADNLTRLKTTVELYVKELQAALESLNRLGEFVRTNPTGVAQIGQLVVGYGLDLFLRIVDLNSKLLNAYREYVAELERMVPR